MKDSYILLVENSVLCAMEASAVLRDNGFNVLEVYCAADAIRVIGGEDRLLALLTDIELGAGADGFDVARCARAAVADLPVVYMSGAAAGRHALEGVSGSEFVPKPFRPQRIVEALNRVIADKGSRPAPLAA